MSSSFRAVLAAILAVVAFAPARAADDEASGILTLQARSRVKDDDGHYLVTRRPLRWDARKTAVVVCDMWDKHWCKGATRRVAEMAPRMNDLIAAARKRGVLIIHCPSACMDRYKDTPQRKLAQQAPKVEAKVALRGWCHLDKTRESALPIDDSDGGCDCQPKCKSGRAWSGQIDAIEIAQGDAVTDSAEAYYLMRQRGITNVIVLGVHTNMCVLGRPFSIRQMVYQGMNVVLVRDMTDTMYNSRMKPFVSHFTGNDLIAEHIERHWCPTITSVDLLGGKPFRFKNDRRTRAAVVIAEREYHTKQTLPAFARAHLGKDFCVDYVFADPQEGNELPGIGILNDADVAVLSVRRRVPPKAQLDVIRKFIADGKPLVAIRTSSHAFALRNGDAPAGHADWPAFDREVLGCNYRGHHSNRGGDGETTFVRVAPSAGDHPILSGVAKDEFEVRSSLYKSQPLEKGATLLMTGRVGDKKPHEPVAWTFVHPGGGRVFYTSLGHAEDFKMESFQRLLKNGIHWAAGKEVPGN